MSALTLTLAAAALLTGTPPPLPDIAGKLPSTWPPPGWPTSVQLPGEPAKTNAPAAAAPDKWVEVFPHVRINRALKAVEFDTTVAWDFHNADTPRTELELLVCLPMRDKEHESLLLSQAKGAHVHAALLMVGFEPGTPGRIDFGDDQNPGVKRIAPVGPFLSVTLRYLKDGKERADNPRSWVIDEAQVQRDADELKDVRGPDPRRTFKLVFGGSSVGQMRNEQGEKVNVYNADELGTLIGLCTFGSETIGNTTVVSPDSGVDNPRYIANNAAIPPADTAVRVLIEAADLLALPPTATADLPDRPDKKPPKAAPRSPAPRP